MNKLTLLGRLTKEPEIRYSQSNNMKVARFTLAVNRKYVKLGEERQTDFLNIVAYSKLAEFTETYLNKGTQIGLVGRLQNRIWEDNNGTKHYITEIIAEEIYFADSYKKIEESNTNVENAQTSSNTVNDNSNNSNVITCEDDLPF